MSEIFGRSVAEAHSHRTLYPAAQIPRRSEQAARMFRARRCSRHLEYICNRNGTRNEARG